MEAHDEPLEHEPSVEEGDDQVHADDHPVVKAPPESELEDAPVETTETTVETTTETTEEVPAAPADE